MRVLRVGFAEVKQSVTVTAGQTATANVQMRAVVTTLAPVVTTATGEQRRVEVGNAIAQVDAAKVVETQAISNIGDLLTSRAAGVTVLRRNADRRRHARPHSRHELAVADATTRSTSSTACASRARPARRRSASAAPTPAAIGDINPEEIENIEIVRGPSASTLYGTDAANGVIVITTKRGVAGRTQWTYYTEQTAITGPQRLSDGLLGLAHRHRPPRRPRRRSNTVQCFLSSGRGRRVRAGQRHELQPARRSGVHAVRHRLPPAARAAAPRRHRDRSLLRVTANTRMRTASRRCRSSSSASWPRATSRSAPRSRARTT